jgi:hypothetical protein
MWAFYKAVRSIISGMAVFNDNSPGCSSGCTGCSYSSNPEVLELNRHIRKMNLIKKE